MQQLSPYKFLLEKHGAMKVPGIIYGSQKIIDETGPEPLGQVINVAALPGITGYSIAMPDIHWGYGFPIGGVAAFDAGDGIISPGGVGYDINCGVRLINTNIDAHEAAAVMEKLIHAVYNAVPAGVGETGDIRLKEKELMKVLRRGASWAVEQGYGTRQDLERTEDNGLMETEAGYISGRALERGAGQLGTLGAGNHFIEIQKVSEIFLPGHAAAYGLKENGVVVLLHTGSRGFGYQVCDDYLKLFREAYHSFGIEIPDSQLVSVPVRSKEGKQYMSSLAAAANFAWANRQVITHKIRQAFEQVFRKGEGKLGMQLVFDVSHNIARMEKHEKDGAEQLLCVHRKGATRALPAGHPLICAEYRDFGQPVLVPGDMGRQSFVLAGAEGAKEAFYSCAHGAGRLLSRAAAVKKGKGRDIVGEMKEKGIIISARNRKLLAEEASYAYKDASEVVDAVVNAGLAVKVAAMKPLAVIKG